MKNNLLFYSTNSELSHWLSKRYYDSVFYIWCSPVFNPKKLDHFHPLSKIPVSSSPWDIYHSLKRDIESDDDHSDKIERNRTGLKKGALVQFEKGQITQEELARINKIIDKADKQKFKPLIYLIPNNIEQERLDCVPIDEVASILSTEYRIADLKEEEFEIISLD